MDLESVTVETDLFEHREVKPHFINPCCFGEDFARWLRDQLADLTKTGFQLSEPIQEDYGWGFWASHTSDPYWIALSFCGEGPTEEPAEWVVSVAYDPGLNLLKRLFHKPDAPARDRLRRRVREVLGSTPGIRSSEMTGPPGPDHERSLVSAFALALTVGGHPLVAQKPTEPPGSFVTVNGHRLWYRSSGHGRPPRSDTRRPRVVALVFLSFLRATQRLDPRDLFDAFGRGRSDHATDPHEYTFAHDVDEVEGLRIALNLGKITVYGHSYGGIVAQAYALKYPASLDHLILANTFHSAEMWQKGRQQQLESRAAESVPRPLGRASALARGRRDLLRFRVSGSRGPDAREPGLLLRSVERRWRQLRQLRHEPSSLLSNRGIRRRCRPGW